MEECKGIGCKVCLKWKAYDNFKTLTGDSRHYWGKIWELLYKELEKNNGR
jgi:hypothetical protein